MNSPIWLEKYQKYKSLIEKANKILEGCLGYRNSLSNLKTVAVEKIATYEDSLKFNNKVASLFQAVSDHAQQQIEKIELICSDALREILGNPDISFKIKMEKKKLGIETTFYINDKALGDIHLMKGEAGAVKNIIAIGLRLIFLELYNPKIEGPVILDEVGGNISVEYQQSFGKFLKKFSELTGRQIILVSHHKPVISESDNKIILRRDDTISMVDNA